jgi:N-acetylmuramoyl-L-alanine amidase
MKQKTLLIWWFCLCLLGFPAYANTPALTAVHSYAHKGVTGEMQRLVLSFSAPVRYRFFVLQNPHRLVVDIPSAQWSERAAIKLDNGLVFSSVRHGIQPDALRVVAELQHAIEIPESVTEPPAGNAPFRLILEVPSLPNSGTKSNAASNRKTATVESLAPEPPHRERLYTQPKEATTKEASSKAAAPQRTKGFPIPTRKPDLTAQSDKPIIIIDAGHGGEDPGAISEQGTQEKTLTLRYARKLRDALNATGDFDARLTREDDRFLRLRERIQIAKKKGGQLFLSLHADSHPVRDTRGFSVYTLSSEASDKEAELLAQRENRADIITGVNLSTTDKDATNILIDLAQRETIDQSARFAKLLVEQLADNVPTLPNAHRSAGFAVLKSPDMPSVLLEMGFLSNAQDEKNLLQGTHEKQLVAGIVQAVEAYFEEPSR